MVNEIIEKTQEYCVFVTDDTMSSSGSGLLYYPGGDVFFVFTCKHVIDDIQSESIVLYLLIPKDPAKDEYQECKIKVPKTQVKFPKDEEKDFAVIQVRKESDLELQPTNYFVGEAIKNTTVLIHGFPGGWADKEDLLEALDYAQGTILHNISSKHHFSLRNNDHFMDQSNRNYELEGFSGAPVWGTEEEICSVMGIISAGARDTTYRARVYAEKMEFIRNFMKNQFNVFMKTKIGGIPESDVAGEPIIQYNGAVFQNESLTEIDNWISNQTVIVRDFIDDLKYRNAIDTAKATIADERFNRGTKETQKQLMQHLLYCYEILLWDEEYIKLEIEMNNRGFIDGHDYLRAITSSFGRKEYSQTIEYVNEWMSKFELDEEKTIIAKTFLLLARIYVEHLNYDDSIKTLLDEHDVLVLKLTNEEIESLIYQMIGYVLCDYFHRHVQAIRCLNKAYRIGFDKMVLETLGGAYHDYAIADALDEDRIVKASEIKRQALYKARECFIIIMDKADDIFWESTIKRMGLVYFDTFFFSMDNYRVFRTYPDVKRYLKGLTEKELRDIELKYARIDCQRGCIDFSHYQALTEQDKILFSTWADLHAANAFFCDNPLHILQQPIVEDQLNNTIHNAENIIETIEDREKMAVHCALINLYGRGIFTYGWDSVGIIKRHIDEIRTEAEPETITSFENFVLECERPFEEVEEVFTKRFESDRNLNNWYELRNLYLRHSKYDEIDHLYKVMFENNQEIIDADSEFVYRDYIDYVTHYFRDMKDAQKCYLDAKDKIKDPDIANYWELELMLYTNTFNDPERFEEERLPFLEKGLITPEIYHIGAFIAYMLNLNAKKAVEHNIYQLGVMQHQSRFITNKTPKELIHFLAWQGLIKPLAVNPVNKFMLPMNEEWARELMKRETWHCETKAVSEKYNMTINRTVVIDGWSLAILAFDDKLELMSRFDQVYVSHLTVSRLMEEASKTALYQIHQVLEWIENTDNVSIVSADFAHQIDIREVIGYGEPESAIALGYEKECPVIIGEPELNQCIADNYRYMIMRANTIDEVISLINVQK